jgi:hypothetical protein
MTEKIITLAAKNNSNRIYQALSPYNIKYPNQDSIVKISSMKNIQWLSDHDLAKQD